MARRYENIETYTTNDGKIIYLPTKYPSVVPSNEDFYIITQATDRLDLIEYIMENDDRDLSFLINQDLVELEDIKETLQN